MKTALLLLLPLLLILPQLSLADHPNEGGKDISQADSKPSRRRRVRVKQRPISDHLPEYNIREEDIARLLQAASSEAGVTRNLKLSAQAPTEKGGETAGVHRGRQKQHPPLQDAPEEVVPLEYPRPERLGIRVNPQSISGNSQGRQNLATSGNNQVRQNLATNGNRQARQNRNRSPQPAREGQQIQNSGLINLTNHRSLSVINSPPIGFNRNPSQKIDVTPRGNHRQIDGNESRSSWQQNENTRGRKLQHLESEGYDGKYFYISLDCGATAMTIKARGPDPFRGRIFIKDRGQQPGCQMTGGGEFAGSLTIPYNNPNCGVVDLGNGTLMTKVVIQRHPQIMMKDDVSYKLLCSFDTKDTVITNSIAIEGEIYTSWIADTAPTPEVRLRIIDIKGNDVTSAKIGDELFLLIQLLDQKLFGIFVTDLVATSGTNSNSITLLDDNGCATEPSVFPLITRAPNSKDLKGKFAAFRFSDDSIVKFKVTVKFCLAECKPVKCVGSGKLGYGRKKREVSDVTTTDDQLPEEIPLQLAIVIDNHEARFTEENPGDVDVNGHPRNEDVCFTRVHVILCAIITVILQFFTIIICLVYVRYLRKRHLMSCKASSDYVSSYISSLNNGTLTQSLPWNRKSIIS